MNRLNLFLFAAALFTSTTIAQVAGLKPGNSVSYKIEQDGKSLGSASFSVQTTPKTYLITSNGKMTEGQFNYSFSNTQKMDLALNLISVQLSGVVNGKAVSFNAASDNTGRQFQLNISANGTQQQNTVDRDQNTVLLTDLDPAAYTLLTEIALRTPSNSWALIPKENGFLVPVKFSAQPDTKAGFNGQTMTVHHISSAVSQQNAITIELFYADDGGLLEADLPEQNIYVIRDGFHLINRPKPPAPPHGQAPPQDQQQTQPPPQASAFVSTSS